MVWLNDTLASAVGFISDYKYAILFYLAVALIVYLNRDRFEKQGIAFLLKTKVGIRLMDRISERHRQLVQILGLSAIGFAFAGLLFIIYAIIDFVSKYFTTDLKTVGVAPVIPGFPIAGTGLVLPLVVGWVCFFIIMVIHEFSHGVVARSFGIPVKSSGIAFFGPFLGAFVEPDEKALAKRPQHEQYALYAAGPISNLFSYLAFSLISVLIVGALIGAVSHVDGIEIAVGENSSAEAAGLKQGDVIYAINGIPALNLTVFDAAAAQTKPGDTVTLQTSRGEVDLVLDTHPAIPFRGYMGINRIEHRVPYEGYETVLMVLKWINDEFLFWLITLNLAIGLINLFPIYITDGARMLKIGLDGAYTKADAKKYWIVANNFCLFLLLLMLIIPAAKLILG